MSSVERSVIRDKINGSSITKLESFESDHNDTFIDSVNFEIPTTYTNPMKRSRKAIQQSIMPATGNQLTSNTYQCQIDEGTTATIPATTTTTGYVDDDISSSTHFDHADEQESHDDNGTDTNDEYSTANHCSSTKRPRLSYTKRLEANARERERVHNLTAAFEALRQVIPMYGDQPKLSRLSILRIACSYVHVLGALNQIDFSQGHSAYTLNEAFHMLSCTILNELKRKRAS